MSTPVLIVASEALPLAKTGGLGDMLSAFAPALQGAGVEPTILMPGYPGAMAQATGLKRVGTLSDLPGGDCVLWRGYMPDTGVRVLLLQNDALYDRPRLYQAADGREWDDNALRFGTLAAAAARIAQGVPGVKRPAIVHAHDWHAGLTPLYMKLLGVTDVKSVFTIHNLAFQGNYPLSLGAELGLPDWVLEAGPDAGGIEFYGQLSFMKAAIRFADAITTVSETYAREIMTPRFGHLMEGVLQENAHKVVGIINGIDGDVWDPRTDAMISRTYRPGEMRGKNACKRALQQLFGLPADPFAPLIALGSRLTWQKMADLAVHTLASLLDTYPRLQVVVLGQGEADAEQAMLRLAHAHPDRVAVHIGYDEKRAHMLHAGADMLLHGSRFEPCGLTPMYAMRYGTVPIASRVGGLADSIVDDGLDPRNVGMPPAHTPLTGFLFDGESVAAMRVACERAIDAFMRPVLWRMIQRNAMERDFSWDGPVARFADLFATLVGMEHVRLKPARMSRVRRSRSSGAANDRKPATVSATA
ncbi:glycogen synthase GlgA [Chitinasiproducens palmae]|uniref:Glycogen synthase n=1 Tax=Chitinasiproducens palmae TaxID=1770053 RepID=A0A1H2PM79_9BURK|nr:glycogen synthase GlgA [Chitinasiproducens palmae]SDV47649.1 starch synthase [Chitinasiproducens palmae]